MANTYQLTINDIPEENRNLRLAYNQDGGSTQTLNIDGTNYKCTLKKISYKKAIYQPGEIHIELQVGKESNAAISFSEVGGIHKAFIGKFFQLQYTGEKTLNIAENYYSFDVKIEKLGSGKPLTVQIQAFDPLKFLSLDKYCRAYTCKKLVTDIITKIDIWPNNLPKRLKEAITEDRKSITEKENNLNNLNNKKNASNTSQDDIIKATDELKTAIQNWWDSEGGFFVRSPHFITYTTKTDSNSNDSEKTNEFIQPYLVQYNESFLDFLARVTNRCGEFFYYEGGKIHIGWKATDPIIIQEYVSVKFPLEVYTAWDNKAIADIHNDYTQAGDKNLRNINDNPQLMRDCELASDENLASIPPKEKYTSWKDFALYPGSFYVNLVSDALCSQYMVDMIADLATSTAATITSSMNSSNKTNDAYEADNFSGAYKDERMQGKDIHPFSTNDTIKSGIKEKDKQVAYSLAYYANIQKGIESAERSRIQIELGDYFHKISLGSMVKLDGDEYIVVKMDSKIDSQDMDGETLKIEAIPYSKENTVYPPSAHVDSIRTAKAQRAIVTHNQDPLKMNRVRVRYPWQGATNTSEDSTPWIRITLPMASDGSGFNFLPEVGDEAMINFENGNIERPYVEGMLYSKGQTVPGDYKRNGARVISSVNGHSIIFSDPSKMNVLKTFSPMLKTLGNFMGIPEIPITDRKATGGIELTDEYGFYSIAMSSSNRSINISSPIGNVAINAFTGITISAPNGNINIEGKNINITAGNNLTLSSGNNISNEFWPFKLDLGQKGFTETKPGVEILKDFAGSILGKLSPVDMKLIRCVMETFLRPIGGTLLVKSNRYMRLEAGKGSTNILGREFTKQRWRKSSSAIGAFIHDRTQKTFLEEFTEEINKSIDIGSLNGEIQKLFNTHLDNHRRIENLKNGYEDSKKKCLAFIIQHNCYFNDTFTPSDEIITNNKKPATFKVKGRSLEKITDLDKAIRDANQYASELYGLVKKSGKETVWKNFKKGCNKNILKIFKDPYVEELMDELITPAYFLDNGTYRQYNNNVTIDIGIKRKIIKYAFELFVKEHNGKNPFKVNLPDTAIHDYKNNLEWEQWVDRITMNEQTKPEVSLSAKAKIRNFAMDAWNIGNWPDQYVWDLTDDGKILISDIKDKTLHIKNNNFEEHTYRVPIAELIRLKRELKTI